VATDRRHAKRQLRSLGKKGSNANTLNPRSSLMAVVANDHEMAFWRSTVSHCYKGFFCRLAA
jgi:hypothetical protein